jgi:hypothetical protein
MTLELVSEYSGRKFDLNAKAFCKVLNLARLEGWQPESVSAEWPSQSSEASIPLPHSEAFVPGRVSDADAEDLRIVLTRAMATGTVAAIGSVQFAAGTLLQIAREGAFQARLRQCATWDTSLIYGAVPA